MEQAKVEMRGTESFEKILSDKAKNKKWLNFAIKELQGHRNPGSARHKEAEDYVEDVKLKILSGEIVFAEGNGNADNFICGIIKNDIKSELRKEPVMVTLREREDYEDEGVDGEDGCGDNGGAGEGAGVEENFIVSFEYPFAVKGESMSSWEVMQKCYAILEVEDPELLVVFDERAKGHPNREIAKYLHVEISEIEAIWKRILRLLKKKISINFS